MRQRQKPGYYKTLNGASAVEEYAFFFDEDDVEKPMAADEDSTPKTVAEALRDPKTAPAWSPAIEVELADIEQQNTWELLEAPRTARISSSVATSSKSNGTRPELLQNTRLDLLRCISHLKGSFGQNH
jgi:hypothetical protein